MMPICLETLIYESWYNQSVYKFIMGQNNSVYIHALRKFD